MAEDAANPNALTVAQVARLQSRAGSSPVTTAMVEADVEAGAPRDPNGTINIVHYRACLVKERVRGK